MSNFDDDNESTRGVTWGEIFDRAKASLLAQLHLSIPASVDKVRTDASGNITDVDCKVLVKDWSRDETGQLVVRPVPLVTYIPVALPGANGVRLTLPVVAGDLGHLVFFGRSIDRWLAGSGQDVDPELYVRNNPTDACFVPGLRPFGSPWSKWPSNHGTLGYDTGVQLHMHSDKFVVADNETGTKKVGLDEDHVDCGTLTIVISAAVPPSTPPFTVVITYTDPFGTTVPVLTFSTLVATPGTTTVSLAGKLQASATQLFTK